MPQYVYQAKDQSLKVIEGTIEAENQTAALSRLGSVGVYPLTISEAVAEASTSLQRPVPRRISSRALADASRQLADLLSGGLPVVNALSLVADQAEQRVLREAVADVAQAVHDGLALSEGLARHPQIFPPLYTNIIKVGEVSGSTDVSLNQLAALFEGESELKAKVASALLYPLIVLVLGVLTILVLLTFVVPKLTSLFLETGQLLPLPTRILLAISGALARWWWAGVLGGVVGVSIFQRVRRSLAGAQWIDRLLLRVPLLGTLLRKLDITHVMQHLGVMVGQRVPLLQALEVASSTASRVPFRHALLQAKEQVRDGVSLSKALDASGEFPTVVSRLVAVGEESGRLDAALLNVATSYRRQTDQALRAATTILEPLLIVAIGLVVMFIVIAMLLPIFELSGLAQ